MSNIIATISFLIDVPEPKTSGVKSGYTPHHKFADISWLASGFHQYQSGDLYFPGETVDAKIRFVSWEELRDIVKPGIEFEIRELERVIGVGIVKTVISD